MGETQLVLEAGVYFTYHCVTVSGCFTSLCPIPSLKSGNNELISTSERCRRAEIGVSVHWPPAQAEGARAGHDTEGESS